jgi:chromosome segregation ATPase
MDYNISSDESFQNNSIIDTTFNDDITSNNSSDKCDQLQKLQQQLNAVQADKEFVWSLWKQLQASKPNITGAIATAIQREQLKNSQKNSKVLEILKLKDIEINELKSSKKMIENSIITTQQMAAQNQNDRDIVHEQMIKSCNERLAAAIDEGYAKQNDLTDKLSAVASELAQCQEREATLHSKIDQMKTATDSLKKQIKQNETIIETIKSEKEAFKVSKSLKTN